MWLMNRARANPPAEGVWLATSTDPDIADGRSFFSVNTAVLQSEFNGYSAKPPAAFDVRLYNAAKAHSDDLIARNAQDHTGQIARVTAAGFNYLAFRGNVFSYADSSLNAHAAWNIDWGSGTADGMQTGRGHRQAIMSLDGAYSNVGVALVYDPLPGVGPYVATGNYCSANPSSDHYNQFIVGTVWRDLNGNSQYDPGEGIGGVTVTPNAGTYYAVTSAGGGYAIPVTMAAGTYPVTFSGNASGTKSVTIAGSNSALLDLLTTGSTPPPPTATTLSATNVTTNSATLNGTVNANNTSTAVTFQYGLTTSYGSSVTASPSPVAGNTNTAVSKGITGLSPNTTYHYRVVGVSSAGTTNGGDLTFKTKTSGTTEARVAASSDDAEQQGPEGAHPGLMYLISSDLELVADTESPTFGNQQVGMRFTGVNVPKGALITNAYIRFRAVAADSPNTNNNPANLTIRGQAADNPTTFTTTDNDISSRPTTSALSAWTPPAWTTGTDYNTPDIKSVVQEIVDRNGWAANQSMVFIITGSGSRSAASYDGSTTTAPLLHIEWIGGATTDLLYLPLIMNTWSPGPAICSLDIDNQTGGQMCYEIYGTGLGRKCVGGGSYFYGSFPAGTYSFNVATACGTVDDTQYFPGGAKVHVISCTGLSSGARPGNNPTTPAARLR